MPAPLEFWNGKSREEWLEIYRAEWRREDEMLAFRDGFDGHITKKALAEKFDLPYQRVVILTRRHDEARDRQTMSAEMEQLKADTFTSIAERLWMDLEWLATQLEQRHESR